MTELHSQTVLTLEEAAEAPRELVGGKARELGRLITAGFDVPSGQVVTTVAAMPAGERGDVPAALLAALDLDGPRAVRSSGVAEDGEIASYAGQFESVLDVNGEDAVADALRRVWASAHSRAADAYRARTGDANDRIAVIVQEMVDADCAGVAFTRNPMTGAEETLIEAVHGLADQLLDGSKIPERWTDAQGGMRRVSGPERVLSAELARQIGATCAAIEEAFGAPQDVEWAVAQGKLWILQARPITALPIEPTERPPENQTWEREDGRFPLPVLPLPSTAWFPRHAECIRRAGVASGLPFDTVETRVYGGRAYTRFRPLGGPDKDGMKPPPKCVFSLLLRLHPAMRRRMKTAREAMRIDLPMKLLDGWEGGDRTELHARRDELLSVDRSALSNDALADHLAAILDHSVDAGTSHFMIGFISGGSTAGALGRFVARHLSWSPTQASDLLQGYSEASARGGVALSRVVEAFASDAKSREMLEERPHDLLHADTPAALALRELLDNEGDLVISMAMEIPTWSEDPTPVFDLVRSQLKNRIERPDPRSFAQAAEQEARAKLEPGLHEEFDELLARARRARPYRDETERDCFAAFGVYRYAVLEAAARLVSMDLLRDVDDVWFLEADELESALRDGVCDADIDRRKGELRWAYANRLPKVMGPPPQPPPDIPFPKSVDPFLGGLFWYLMNSDTGPEIEASGDADFHGLGCSPGTVTGRVRVIKAPEELHHLEAGEILVCPSTTAQWAFAFPLIKGLICEAGGPLSHPATLAREFALPGVLCVENATTELKTGDWITMDGVDGTVRRAEPPVPRAASGAARVLLQTPATGA